VTLADFETPTCSILDLTGFHCDTLQQVWDTYNAFGGSAEGSFGGQLAPPERGGTRVRIDHSLCIYVYIHKAPQTNWPEAFKLGSFGMARNHWQPMWDVADALAAIIDEINYSDRLHPYNHVGRPFKYFVTALVDTFPVYVPAPGSFSMRRLLFQPKYDACVLKILGVTFMGNIVLWTGPHLGVTSDKTIWENTWAWHPFQSWEWWLGDLGTCSGLEVTACE
jgi:hypothetical protein